MLRSQLLRRLQRANANVLAVTSAQPGAGKTFTVCNLAARLSRLTDVTVLIVDLDLRLPSVARHFNIEQEFGMSDFFDGHVSLSEIGLKLREQNLVIFPSYGYTADAAEVLSSPRCHGLIDAFRNLPPKHIVLVDIPPIFEFDDAMIVAQLADAVLFVIEDGESSEDELVEALRLLQDSTLIGTVLNKADRASVLNNYSYSYYYR